MSDLKRRLGATVFEQAPCHVAVIDRHHRVLSANARFNNTFGQRQGEPCYAVFKGLEHPCEICFAAKVFEDGTVSTSRERGITKEGKPISYEVQAVPVHGEGEVVEQVLLMSIDTTRLSDLEQELEQAERMAIVGLTAAGLAHTIKNILEGLEGATYTVNSGLERDDRERLNAGWEMVSKYIEQVTTLVENLLHYAKEQESHRHEVDPGGLVERVVELFDSKASLVNIQLEGQVDDSLTPVWIDTEAMYAGLTNLVSNAMDACMWDPDDGKKHLILVEALPRPGGGVVFEVSDNGMGIPEENQCKVLAAFFTTKGIRGTGLGLLLTKKAVQKHGGRISFTSTPGQGTTFRIELPTGTKAE